MTECTYGTEHGKESWMMGKLRAKVTNYVLLQELNSLKMKEGGGCCAMYYEQVEF
jgi:hypothetical protein